MRIHIEIEVTGNKGEIVSLTTHPVASIVAVGEASTEEQDAGGPPTDMIDEYAQMESESLDNVEWMDAGPAPEMLPMEDNTDNASNADLDKPEEAGGPSQQ